MKNKEFKELRTKKTSDLQKLVGEKKLELIKIMADIKISRQKNLKAGKNLRRDIAKILTAIRENEIMESVKQDVNKSKK